METLKFFYLLAIFAFVSSCSSSNSQLHSTNSPLTFGKVISDELMLYANIKKLDNGRYRIESYSTVRGDIRLNDLSPMFSTKSMSCSTNIGWKEYEEEVECDTDVSLFRKFSQNGEALAANVAMSYFTALGAIVTAGGVVLASYGTAFDYDEYVEFTKKNLSYRDRIEIFNKFNSANRSYESMFNKQFQSLQEKQLKTRIHPKIIDDTGLFDRGNFGFSIKREIEAVGNLQLTWTGDSDFQIKYQEKISSLENAFHLKANCKIDTNYQVSTIGCDKTVGLESRQEIISPIINVHYLREGKLKIAPQYANDDIEVIALKSGRIRIINKTPSFISVDSISLYLNDEVRNLSNLGIEIAPESYLKQSFDLSAFSDYTNLTKLQNINKEKLDEDFNYGLAIKYRGLDKNKQKTLYEKTRSKIGSLLLI